MRLMFRPDWYILTIGSSTGECTDRSAKLCPVEKQGWLESKPRIIQSKTITNTTTSTALKHKHEQLPPLTRRTPLATAVSSVITNASASLVLDTWVPPQNSTDEVPHSSRLGSFACPVRSDSSVGKLVDSSVDNKLIGR